MIANPISWPNGARCACSVTFDMDADSLVHLEHPRDSHRRVSTVSTLRYGPTVAVPRIVETYRRLGLKQTFFVPAWCIEQYPEAIETILEGGHEIGHHSYIHENPIDQTREGEAHWLDLGIEIIKRTTGRMPRGWRAPLYNFSDHSLDLLTERGFEYDASLMGDDIPYVIKSRLDGRELIELPTHWGLDDWPQYVQAPDLNYMMPVRSARNGLDLFRDEFEAAYEYGGLWVPVVHPFVTGRLARWHVFSQFLENLVVRGDVWFAPMEEIARHARTEIAKGHYRPRVELIPQYVGPISR
ncbi:polysaccharide deacetylase [Methylobacterium planeticum]|uniref:Chitooligosaccharide deacetylase n=2 Tax=Methylobacterium planeticum TaxID=2615211 RepID=A0A6N6MJI3_9HYPH|nr:polysaccharide deacetylase [Methylobacterium planeticum]